MRSMVKGAGARVFYEGFNFIAVTPGRRTNSFYSRTLQR